jgi:hypothetical protein
VLGQLSRDSWHVRVLPTRTHLDVLQKPDDALSYLAVRLELMIIVLRSSKKPRLALLVSLVGHIEVAVDASFLGIVRSSPAGVSSFSAVSAIQGPAVTSVWITPQKHYVAP